MTKGRRKNETFCTVCQRMVGVAENWSHWQAGMRGEWRVTRHATEFRGPICGGAGIMVSVDVVFPVEDQVASS